jgi:hypothetical protein
MSELAEALKGHFTMVNLGCIGDDDLRLPGNLAKSLTVVEVDMEGQAATSERYHRKIFLKIPVSGVAGKHTFRKNSFAGGCSLYDPLDGVVRDFGLDRYYRELARLEEQCETLPNLIRAQGLEGIDMLKTDVEGADTEVIKSCKEYLGKIHMIQCELRFRPFYTNEPSYIELASFLAQNGYEVLDLVHIDRWKYKTPHWHWQLEGRAVFADFLFVLQPERLENFKEGLPLAIAKQIILSCMMGKRNYGEYLLVRFKDSLSAGWIPELQELVKPRFPNWQQFRQELRRTFMPLELFLKHRIKRSEHAAIR